jgi:glycosyltransferase involved in cell wall biosynthesis
LSDEETLQRMQRASIIAMPSLQEGLGLSLQEALFHGCVGLGTYAGGIPELIDHESNGLLVQPGDVDALSTALDRLISQPALLDKFRAQCRPSIIRKGMTSSAMLQNYLDLYQTLLKP